MRVELEQHIVARAGDRLDPGLGVGKPLHEIGHAGGYRTRLPRMRHWLLAVLFVPLIARADDVATRAQKLHGEAIVVDTHLDAPDQLSNKWADVAVRGATDHFDIPRA